LVQKGGMKRLRTVEQLICVDALEIKEDADKQGPPAALATADLFSGVQFEQDR
jgi:hypothetical protein